MSKIYLTAQRLLELAENAQFTSAKNVHRLVAEVFRLRAKLRAAKPVVLAAKEECLSCSECIGSPSKHHPMPEVFVVCKHCEKRAQVPDNIRRDDMSDEQWAGLQWKAKLWFARRDAAR